MKGEALGELHPLGGAGYLLAKDALGAGHIQSTSDGPLGYAGHNSRMASVVSRADMAGVPLTKLDSARLG
jgi:hypothetical protein